MPNFSVANGTTDTGAKTLDPGQTGTVAQGGTLRTNSSGTATITWSINGAANNNPASITNSGTIANTSGQVLAVSNTTSNPRSFTITNNATGTITGATNVATIAPSLNGGTFRIDNAGSITAQAGRGFNFQNYSRLNLTLTNGSGGTIQATDDALRLTGTAGLAITGTITITNTGTIKTTGTGSGQALDLGDISALGASGTVTVTNNSGGVIEAADADAIRGAAGMTLTKFRHDPG